LTSTHVSRSAPRRAAGGWSASQSASVVQAVSSHHSPACDENGSDPGAQSAGGGPRSSAEAAVARKSAASKVNRAMRIARASRERLVTAVTLGVREVAASRRFYIEGLGWPVLWEQPTEILFVQVAAGQMLALWNVQSMPSEYGDVAHPPAGASAIPISLGRNV